MSLSVFVSATRKDLDPDCRPAAIDAISYQPAADADKMEAWVSEHRDPLAESLEQVENASHYVGIFGFWRGYVPAGETCSITESEYRHAVKTGRRRSVFLPEDGSDIEAVLQNRAIELGLEDPEGGAKYRAQIRFLAELRKKTVIFFPSAQKLAAQVAGRVAAWRDLERQAHESGGPAHLLSFAEEEPVAATARTPPRDGLQRIALTSQIERFEHSLGCLEPPARIAFIVHGPAGCGHDRAAEALALTFEEQRGGKRLEAAVCSQWTRGREHQHLIERLGKKTLRDLAFLLLSELEARHVLLDISGLEDWGLDAFRSEFWNPLMATMDGFGITPPDNDLIALLRTGETASGGFAEASAAALANGAMVCLPALAPVEQGRLLNWLRAKELEPWVTDLGHAKRIKDGVMAASRGELERLWAELGDPQTWEATREP